MAITVNVIVSDDGLAAMSRRLATLLVKVHRGRHAFRRHRHGSPRIGGGRDSVESAAAVPTLRFNGQFARRTATLALLQSSLNGGDTGSEREKDSANSRSYLIMNAKNNWHISMNMNSLHQQESCFPPTAIVYKLHTGESAETARLPSRCFFCRCPRNQDPQVVQKIM